MTQRVIEIIKGLSERRTFSGASDFPSKITASYRIIPKITKGIVTIKSLLIVVVLLSSARKSHTGRDAFGL